MYIFFKWTFQILCRRYLLNSRPTGCKLWSNFTVFQSALGSWSYSVTQWWSAFQTLIGLNYGFHQSWNYLTSPCPLSHVPLVNKAAASLRIENAKNPRPTRSGLVRRYAGDISGSAALCQPDMEYIGSSSLTKGSITWQLAVFLPVYFRTIIDELWIIWHHFVL